MSSIKQTGVNKQGISGNFNSLIYLILFLMIPALSFTRQQRQTIEEYAGEPKISHNEIPVKKIPATISAALKATYPKYKVAKAYRGSDDSYKIILEMKEDKLVAWYHAGGEFLRIEQDKGDDKNMDD